MTEQKSIIAFVTEILSERIKATRQNLKDLQKDQKTHQAKEEDKRLIFHIKFYSLWANYGEKHLDYTSPKPEDLESAFKAGCEEFKLLNSRSDVQAEITVFVCLPKGTQIKLPDEYWYGFYEKYGRHHG